MRSFDEVLRLSKKLTSISGDRNPIKSIILSKETFEVCLVHFQNDSHFRYLTERTREEIRTGTMQQFSYRGIIFRKEYAL